MRLKLQHVNVRWNLSEGILRTQPVRVAASGNCWNTPALWRASLGHMCFPNQLGPWRVVLLNKNAAQEGRITHVAARQPVREIVV